MKELHLPAFRASYEELARQAQQEALSYEQYLLGLAQRECQERRQRRIERLLRSRVCRWRRAWAALDLKRLPAKVVQQMRSLLEGSFVDRRENVLVFGVPGSGKTHLLCALGQELVRSGRRVLFWTTCGLLVQELLVAKRDLKLSRVLKRLAGYEVLILDDLGYVQQSREEMEVLFTLLAERYERGSVLLTSNLPFSGWEAIFKDADDDGGGDRPPGASQRDRGVEPAELPRGAGQEGEGEASRRKRGKCRRPWQQVHEGAGGGAWLRSA